MKYLVLNLFLSIIAANFSFADSGNSSPNYYCEESAIQYVVDIVSAPYKNSSTFVFDKKHLKIVAISTEGDGAEVYENITVQHTIDEGESYSLRLYVQEIGGVCALEKFELK